MTFPSKESPSPFPAHARPIPVLLVETDMSFTTAVQNILQVKFALRHFNLTVVSNLREAFREIDAGRPDVVLIDLDPQDDPELTMLTRLHAHVPQVPIVALVADKHQKLAPSVLQKGAQHYLLESQISEDILPAFLMRTIERHAAQQVIRESEEQFRLMIENASDVILILDHAGLIIYAGPSTERILNHRPADLMGKNALDFFHRDDRGHALDQFEQAFKTGEAVASIPFRFRRPDESWLHMEGKGRIVRDPSGRKICILNSHDVSHRVKLEDELRSLSLRDELTGLHNRRSFVTVLDQQLKQAQRSKKRGIYLLFIDLDDFKWINDNLSHKEGDNALRDAARILKNTFREADIVARLGGDEFVVFVTDELVTAHVDRLKERLSLAVDDWNQTGGRPYRLAMSVGVVHHDLKERVTTEDLLFKADELMYAQKREKKRRKAEAGS